MRFIIISLIIIGSVGCGGPEVTQSYSSEGYRAKCTRLCQEKFKTDVDWVSDSKGTCYCK